MRPSIFVVHLECVVGVRVCVWPGDILSMIAHVLDKLELEELCGLGIHSLWGFPKVARQFVVNFIIGEPFFAYVNFMATSFCEPIVLVVSSLLCMLGWCLKEV